VTDSEGFDTFYRATRQRVYDCLYALTGSPAEAQDAVQEAYARAWQRWNTVGEYADPEAWVRTVARRIAISGWRHFRSGERAYRRAGPPPPVPGPNPDHVVLVDALSRLSVAHRTAIVLHHLVGMSVVDIAREIGVPEGTVKARLARGRRALASVLGLDDPEDSYV
jgi:RNA polymerase sigma-70 factor (ECF subfamily)